VYWPIILFFGLALAEVAYFSTRGIGNDFPVFHDASRLALKLSSPWDAVFDPIYSAYLNGPLTAMLIAPLGIFSQSLALLITRTLSVAVIPFLVFLFLRFLLPHKTLGFFSKDVWIISSLLLFTFPVRANLEYGQFYLVFITLAVLGLKLSLSESAIKLFISGLLLGICCDYKPQSFLVFALIFCFTNVYIFFGLSFSVILGAIFSTILTKTIPYQVWIEVILEKSKGGSTEDQMHLYEIIPGSISLFFALGLFILATTSTIINKLNGSERVISIIFVTTLLTPWMHPTDLVLYGLFAVVLTIQPNRLTTLSSFGLGSFLVWSNSYTISILVALVVFSLLLAHGEILKKLRFVQIFLILIPSTIFSYTSNEFPEFEGVHRQFWGMAGIVIITMVSTHSQSLQIRKGYNTKT
jgi:hypothetical protein